MHTKMNRSTKALGTAIVATTVLAFILIGCSAGTDDDCRTQYVPMFYSLVDHHYHYGSVTGKTVPAAKVPSEASKVPGYKPYNPPKPAPKVNAPAPRPAAPAPRPATPPKAPSFGKR